MAQKIDEASDLFLPIIILFGPWSGEILINGNPRVILIALKLYKVFNGVKTWSWYIPTATSYLLIFFFKKNVSAENGPSIFKFNLFKKLIAGIIVCFSSLILSIVSQWGLSPNIAIFGFLCSKFL